MLSSLPLSFLTDRGDNNGFDFFCLLGDSLLLDSVKGLLLQCFVLGLQLTTIFIINQSYGQLNNRKKPRKKDAKESKVTSSEKQLLTSEKLKGMNIWYFCLRNQNSFVSFLSLD